MNRQDETWDGPTPFSVGQRKIDPSRRPARRMGGAGTFPVRPDGTPDDNDRVEIGPTALAFQEWEARGLTPPDLPSLREYRLARLRGQLVARECAGLLLFDPINIRYATDSTNMQIWIAHNAARACFIATDGPVILFDFHNCTHLSEFLPLVDEVRPGPRFFYFSSGAKVEEKAAAFADQIRDLVKAHGGGNYRLAIDKIEPPGLEALKARGITCVNGQAVTEHARAIKNENEINAIRCVLASCEISMREMQAAMRPGLSENALWAELHRANIARGGEWIETRLLASGPRTNPWFQECGPRIIQDGDVVAFDTDLIGPYGYCADISRTWVCGDKAPPAELRDLYKIAHEHIMTNAALLRPGMAFSEFVAQAHRLPEPYRVQRYSSILHGVGMCDEYPSLPYPEDLKSSLYDGVIEAGMVLCVEAYVGAVGGPCGVKLEDQVLVTQTGSENLTRFPFEERLLR